MRRGRLVWIILFIILLLALFAIPPDSRSGGLFELAPRLRKLALASQLTTALTMTAPIAIVALLLIALSTLLFGRVFCSVLCPAGMIQELAHRLGRRLKLSRLCFTPPARRVWIWLIVGLCGLFGVATHWGGALIADAADPVGLTGRLAAVAGEFGRRLFFRNDYFALTGPMLAAAAVSLVLLVLLPLTRGRWFCDRLCPAGMALGLLAERARRRMFLDEKQCGGCGKCARACPTRCIDPRGGTLDFSRCVLCLDCLETCPSDAIRYARPEPASVLNGQIDPARRGFLLSLGSYSAGAVYLSSRFLGERFPLETGVPELAAPMPPGAGEWRRYRQRCVGCWSCVQACPEGILRPSSAWRTPFMNFERGYCQYDCVKCTQVCPTLALDSLTIEKKKNTRVAISSLDLLRCVAVADSEACGACAELCPTFALTMRHQPDGLPSLPDLDRRYCIGCGACVVACPVNAFVITPLSRQETSAGVRDTGPPPMEVEPPDTDGMYDFPV